MINTIYQCIWGGIFCGLFGALGGSEDGNKSYRGIIIPIFLIVMSYFHLETSKILYLSILFATFAVSYGRTSPLKLFYEKLFNNNQFYTDILTRGTLGTLMTLSLIIIPIIKQNWILYIIVSFIIINIYSWISWRSLRSFYFWNIHLTESEFWTYFGLGLGASLLIYF
jgi:hypothetical protein